MNNLYKITAVCFFVCVLQAKLTLEEKIAQLLVVAVVSDEERNKDTMKGFKEWAGYDLSQQHARDLISNQKIGGVIFYGDNTDAHTLEEVIAEFQSLSATPLFIGLDT